jgi:hypothetical protein
MNRAKEHTFVGSKKKLSMVIAPMLIVWAFGGICYYFESQIENAWERFAASDFAVSLEAQIDALLAPYLAEAQKPDDVYSVFWIIAISTIAIMLVVVFAIIAMKIGKHRLQTKQRGLLKKYGQEYETALDGLRPKIKKAILQCNDVYSALCNADSLLRQAYIEHSEYVDKLYQAGYQENRVVRGDNGRELKQLYKAAKAISDDYSVLYGMWTGRYDKPFVRGETLFKPTRKSVFSKTFKVIQKELTLEEAGDFGDTLRSMDVSVTTDSLYILLWKFQSTADEIAAEKFAAVGRVLGALAIGAVAVGASAVGAGIRQGSTNISRTPYTYPVDSNGNPL